MKYHITKELNKTNRERKRYMTLAELTPGNKGKIKQIGGEGALRRRLLDMGLTPNTQVEVRKIAPLGDPMEIFLRGYVLTLRIDDAAKIEMFDGIEKA